MRILMLAPQPFFQPRGTPFSVLHRLKALSSLGHHVDLITYHIGEDVKIENVNIHRTAKIPFIKKIEIGPSYTKIVCDFFLLLEVLKFLARSKYDVLHTHEEAGFMAPLLKRLFKIPYIYDMHSSLPQQLKNFNRGNRKLIVKTFEWLEKMTISRADGIITICDDLQRTVKSIAVNKDPVLIENVADNSVVFGSLPYLNVREKYKIPQNTRVVLYTGTFERYQGVELLLASGSHLFKKHPSAVYVLVGGNGQQIENMEKLAEGLGIRENIIFTGTVHPGEIEYFYKISDVIVSPRIEGTNAPLKIYSYLRSGTPIVATNLYTHTQVLNDEVALLAEPDPIKFADAISRVLDDGELRNRIVKGAAKLAQKKYSYERYLELTERVYRKVMNGKVDSVNSSETSPVVDGLKR